ncbi:MAG: substrate-binding periplasmic protein [Hyphomicrobiaceae bacterium]
MKLITVKSVLLALIVSPITITSAHAVGGAKAKPDSVAEQTKNTPAVDRVKAKGKLVICADPDNMPFSRSTPNPTGLDIDVARHIANELGVELGHYWWRQNSGRRSIRQLREEKCDAFLGLPVSKDFVNASRSMVFTQPYYQGGFAIIKRKGSKINSFDDLKDKTVGVQMVTVPDIWFANEGVKRSLHRTPESAVKAVLDGEIEVAVITAPAAGWLAREHGDKLEVLSKTRKDFAYPMGIGVNKGDPDLRDAIDKIIEKMKADGRIQKTLDSYNVKETTVSGVEKKSNSSPGSQAQKKKLTLRQRKKVCLTPRSLLIRKTSNVARVITSRLAISAMVRT